MPLPALLENAIVASTISVGFYLMASLFSQHSTRSVLAEQLQKLQSDLSREKEKRAADRSGRIRAERQLKEARLQLATEQALRATTENTFSDQAAALQQIGAADASRAARLLPSELPVYPLRPIGILRSCFTNRCVSHSMRMSCCLCLVQLT
jgi:hypothetical protein